MSRLCILLSFVAVSTLCGCSGVCVGLPLGAVALEVDVFPESGGKAQMATGAAGVGASAGGSQPEPVKSEKPAEQEK